MGFLVGFVAVFLTGSEAEFLTGSEAAFLTVLAIRFDTGCGNTRRLRLGSMYALLTEKPPGDPVFQQAPRGLLYFFEDLLLDLLLDFFLSDFFCFFTFLLSRRPCTGFCSLSGSPNCLFSSPSIIKVGMNTKMTPRIK